MNEIIYLIKFSLADGEQKVAEIIKTAFLKCDLLKHFSPNDLTAIKVHFGEDGNSSFLPSIIAKEVAKQLLAIETKPFVSDTNVLYKSRRDNGFDHLVLAGEHGFSLESVGVPIVIADGIIGKNEIEIKVELPLNKTVFLASDFVSSDSIVVVTHVTGHLLTGLGATIKNLGMGMASRKGKRRQHSVSKPHIKEARCTACGQCIKWCPKDAIFINEKTGKALIDDFKCIGCGECLAVCRQNAVGFNWDSTSSDLQKQMAEHAYGITSLKKGKICYLTFLVNMTKDCDCLKQEKKFILDDIGVLVGDDPVAIDQAVLDLTKQSDKKNMATIAYPKHDPTIQLAYGEKIGLGKRAYTLVEIN